MNLEPVQQAMREAWLELEGRLAAYRLVLPGSPAFICQPQTCTAHCCHAFSVSLGEGESARMTRETGMQMVEFVELEEGQPITLPLAQPYLLAREGGHCRFLSGDLGCEAYPGRPNACRLYPHFVVFWDSEERKPLFGVHPDAEHAVERALQGEVPHPLPLLLGHTECPGFTGPPLPEAVWRALLAETYHMQIEAV
jgi:Fe-S-cluster containining protein